MSTILEALQAFPTVKNPCSSCGEEMGWGQGQTIPGKGKVCSVCFRRIVGERRSPEMEGVVGLVLSRHNNRNDGGLREWTPKRKTKLVFRSGCVFLPRR